MESEWDEKWRGKKFWFPQFFIYTLLADAGLPAP